MNFQKTKLFSIAAPSLWAAIVVILHIIPVSVDQEDHLPVPHADKLVHFSMFAILSFLIYRSIKFNSKKISSAHLLLIFLICICFGGMMELIQGTEFMKRDSDILDWSADIAGTITGIIIARTSVLTFFFRHEIRETT